MGTGTRPDNLADKSIASIDFIVMPKVLVGVPLGRHCTRGGFAAASRMNKHNEQVPLDSPASNILPADRVYGRIDPVHRRTITASIRKRTVLRTRQEGISGQYPDE